jgi:hypothetical protein
VFSKVMAHDSNLFAPHSEFGAFCNHMQTAIAFEYPAMDPRLGLWSSTLLLISIIKFKNGMILTKKEMTYTEMVYLIGRMRGAVRVSVGIATNQSDLDEFIAFSASIQNLSVDDVVMQCTA